MRNRRCWKSEKVNGRALRFGKVGCYKIIFSFTFASLLYSATAFAQSQLESEEPAGALEEVLVTARRISENVQDIPMSVQVLSAAFLETAKITSFYELQFNIPGLVIHNVGLFGAGFTLRGISSLGGSGESIATHLDGVYLADANLAITRMFDLERIEALKGPQGTLYGRNATGGSINMLTRRPQEELSSEIEAAYGSYNTLRAQGHVNLPFNTGAFRLAFIGSEGDGYIRNTVDDRTFGEADFWGLRAALRIDSGDRLLMDFMAQHVTDDGGSGELWGPVPQYLPDPDDIRLTTVTLANPYLEKESDFASVNIAYDFGFATMSSITGYAHSKVRNLDDCAGSPNWEGCIRGADPLLFDQWSQEFQLVSQGSKSLDWLLGANYFEGDESSYFHVLIPRLNPLPLNNEYSESEETAYAIFGQATWNFSQNWYLTGGLRFSHEKESGSDQGTGVRDNPELTTAENDWTNTSWRLGLEYTATDEIMIYANISTGFKGGGVSTTRLPNGEFDNYEPETLTAYELGANSQWLNRRLTLNGSAFYYDFSNMQINSTFFFDNALVNDTENAAKAELFGLDISGDFQVTDRITLSGGLVWMPKREFVDFVSEWTEDVLSGNTIPRAPEWNSTTAINYQLPLGNRGNVSVRLEYNYRSSFYFTKENNPALAQNSFGLLNLFLTYEPADQNWRVFAIGRNLTNADYYNQIFLQSSPGYPATWEAGLSVSF